jgi:hypothetical protein
MTITEAEASDGSNERPPTLPGEDPAGEDPAGEAPAGEADEDAHPAPISATAAIAATSLPPLPIPISPFDLAVRPCGRHDDGHRRL